MGKRSTMLLRVVYENSHLEGIVVAELSYLNKSVADFGTSFQQLMIDDTFAGKLSTIMVSDFPI